MYCVATYHQKFSARQEAKIQSRLDKLGHDLLFIRHEAAGNSLHAWIERPNDGCNDYSDMKPIFAAACQIVAEEIRR